MKVSVLLANGFETVEALAVIDVLRRANIEVETVSINDCKTVVSAQNIPVVADNLFEAVNFDETDVLFLPGGAAHAVYMKTQHVLDLVKEHNSKGKRLAAICAAPRVFGLLGLLDGKEAICFPGFEQDLLNAKVLSAPVKTVTDGNITTSRGMGTAIDLGLELVSLLVNEECAKELAKTIQYV